jgi:hypothetical protein
MLPQGQELPIIIFIIVLQSILVGALWLYPIIECAVHHPKTPKKDIWIFVITGIPLIGGFLYLMFGRPFYNETNETEKKDI